jgi:hypothetical protein
MPYDADTGPWLSPAGGPLDVQDRILLGVCAVIWLVVLGAGVAATVALVDLGRGHTAAAEASGTPWVLYTVIGVSAVVIIAAVPLLIRARRRALTEPRDTAARPTPGASPTPVGGAEAPTEKLRVLAPIDARPDQPSPPPATSSQPARTIPATVDQLWLRCPAVIGCAAGVATVAIAVATYLMAVSDEGLAWVGYGIAGVITLALPVIPWFYLRQLRRELEAARS